jgi:hypothetical protein
VREQKRQFWGEECDLEGEDKDGGSVRNKEKGKEETNTRVGKGSGGKFNFKFEDPP